MVERRLKILQVSTADHKGGAERIAWNLFESYRRLGHESWLAVGQKHSPDPNVLRIPAPSLLQALGGYFSKRYDYFAGHEDFHFPGTRQLLFLLEQPPDLLHVHNLHGYYFDLRRLPRLCQQLPVLLTLHDAWLLSGHCAHSLGCDRWKTGCGQCPDLSLYPAIRRDATAANWQRKRRIFARSSLYVATPSRWLMNKVEQSLLSPSIREARVIPNGVDPAIFHLADRSGPRDQLGIPQDAVVLLTTGIDLRQNAWKDYATLHEAIRRLEHEPGAAKLVVLALGTSGEPEQQGQVVIRHVPYQSEPAQVAACYHAADLYVHSARADTFPNAILEAMACGLPVVASAVGGIPEQVSEGLTGFLVQPGDAAGMAARILQLCSTPGLRISMGSQAEQQALQHYTLRCQSDAYLEWYHQMIHPLPA
jgi:glycosyltransferase involved in cell wall biosynthesis